MNYKFYTDNGDFVSKFAQLNISFLQYGANEMVDYSGNGYISGELKVKGVPIENGTINLYTESTKSFVSSTVTDENGNYRFDNIDENLTYFIVAIEPSKNWEYRVQSRILPAL